MTTIESLIKEAYRDFSGGTEKVASGKVLNIDEARKMSTSLLKVASLPYNEGAYDAVCGIMKLAGDVLSNVIDELQINKDRTRGLEKISAVRELIDEMLDMNLIDKFDVIEKTAALLKKDERELSIVKEAMLMAANPTGKNIFDDNETEKVASVNNGKKGIFDSVMV